MAAKTYGEYLEPVNSIIDETYPEGTKVETRDLRIIAYLAAVTVLETKYLDEQAEVKKPSTEGEV